MLMVVFIFELKAELPTRSRCLGARETSVTSVAEDGKGQPTNRLRYTIARRSRRLCYSARIKQVNFKAVVFIWKKAIITIYFLNILYRILMCIGEPEFDLTACFYQHWIPTNSYWFSGEYFQEEKTANIIGIMSININRIGLDALRLRIINGHAYWQFKHSTKIHLKKKHTWKT